MDIGEIATDALRYPFSDFKKVIILGILFIISFLIIPAFLVLGYVFKALKACIVGVSELPDLDDWGGMFVDGLKVFVVQLVYFIIPFLIIFVGILASIASIMSIQSEGTFISPTAAIGTITGVAIIGVFLMIVIIPIFAMAVANMAYYNGELGAAFRFSEIIDKIGKIGWVDLIIWYVVLWIIFFIIGIVSSILGLIPVIGWIILILLVYPYLYLFLARYTALLYISDK
ncbi:MAG: DUF4013 domain-containing protein [Euryarchaeota archaeon]|nr:DUF4013 domain-containing protein [Euryarchaeota archaeon]